MKTVQPEFLLYANPAVGPARQIYADFFAKVCVYRRILRHLINYLQSPQRLIDLRADQDAFFYFRDSFRLTLQQGIATEKAREIVKKIKDSKLKVQASIQGDFVRIAGRDRDTLQSAIKILRETDFGIDMQFTNYRTN